MLDNKLKLMRSQLDDKLKLYTNLKPKVACLKSKVACLKSKVACLKPKVALGGPVAYFSLRWHI